MDMNRSKATAGTSLLCILAFCACVAQSALAAEGKNTTAVTCVKGGGDLGFSDAHCDSSNIAGAYGHVAIETGRTVSFFISNEKTKNETKDATNAVFKGWVFGVKLEITCKSVGGEGTFTNEEPSSKVHRVRGSFFATYTSCTVNSPALGCKVKEPININASFEGVEGLGEGRNEMGIEFKPWLLHFSEISIEGCFIEGTYNMDGKAIATSNTSNIGKSTGATSVFTNAMTKETLKLAGNPAEISSTVTIGLGKEPRPISLATIT
jgi:hypothetical protein